MRCVLAIAIAMGSLGASRAEAQPVRARHALRWTRAPGAETCLDVTSLTTAVEARLRRPVFAAGAADILIEAHVRPLDSGWQVAIAVRDRRGASLGGRELEEASPDCRALDQALVLVIALIVDPDAMMNAAPAPPTSPIAPWHLAISARGAASAGLLPGVSLGASLTVTIDAPELPAVSVRGGIWPSDELQTAAHGSRFDLATAGLAVCPTIRRVGRAALSMCAGLEVGRIAAQGFGFDRSERARALVGYVVVEPRGSLALRGGWSVDASLGTWIPVVRPRFVYDQAGTSTLVYQAPAGSLVGQLGVGLHF